MDQSLDALKRKRGMALAVFTGSSLVSGGLDVLLYQSEQWLSISKYASLLVGIVAIVAWCRFDSRIQGYPISIGLAALIWLVACVGVPLYLIRTRGFVGAVKIGFGLPVFLASVALYYGGWYATYWLCNVTGYFSK